jgi:hypothetical protein
VQANRAREHHGHVERPRRIGARLSAARLDPGQAHQPKQQAREQQQAAQHEGSRRIAECAQLDRAESLITHLDHDEQRHTSRAHREQPAIAAALGQPAHQRESRYRAQGRQHTDPKARHRHARHAIGGRRRCQGKPFVGMRLLGNGHELAYGVMSRRGWIRGADGRALAGFI